MVGLKNTTRAPRWLCALVASVILVVSVFSLRVAPSVAAEPSRKSVSSQTVTKKGGATAKSNKKAGKKKGKKSEKKSEKKKRSAAGRVTLKKAPISSGSTAKEAKEKPAQAEASDVVIDIQPGDTRICPSPAASMPDDLQAARDSLVQCGESGGTEEKCFAAYESTVANLAAVWSTEFAQKCIELGGSAEDCNASAFQEYVCSTSFLDGAGQASGSSESSSGVTRADRVVGDNKDDDAELRALVMSACLSQTGGDSVRCDGLLASSAALLQPGGGPCVLPPVGVEDSFSARDSQFVSFVAEPPGVEVEPGEEPPVVGPPLPGSTPAPTPKPKIDPNVRPSDELILATINRIVCKYWIDQAKKHNIKDNTIVRIIDGKPVVIPKQLANECYFGHGHWGIRGTWGARRRDLLYNCEFFSEAFWLAYHQSILMNQEPWEKTKPGCWIVYDPKGRTPHHKIICRKGDILWEKEPQAGSSGISPPIRPWRGGGALIGLPEELGQQATIAPYVFYNYPINNWAGPDDRIGPVWERPIIGPKPKK